MRATTPRRIARNTTLVTVCLVIAAAFISQAVGRVVDVRTTPNRPSIRLLGWPPIAGDATSIEEARSRVAFPVLALPRIVLPDICDAGSVKPLTLLQAWATPLTEAQADRQAGANYSHQIAMSVTPASSYGDNTYADGELRPLALAFHPEDFPAGVRDGVVRGHVAWINPLNEKLDLPTECVDSSGTRAANDVTPSSPDPDLATRPRLLDVLELTHLTWMEGGGIHHLVGPYSVLEMATIAEAATID